MSIKRRKTKAVFIGGVQVGGGAPVSIQSMTKTDTRDVKKTAAQIKELEKSGCQIVRVAVKDIDAAKAIRYIKQKIKIPLVADIHFDCRLAVLAIQNKADKIRLNPGNIVKKEDVEFVVRAAKAHKIPVRIGVNSGSIRCPKKMVEGVLGHIRIFEKNKFGNIIVSLKSSDVPATVEAYRIISRKCAYPLHLGVTTAGLPEDGKIKSAVGIGALLLDGIGDTMRVSLTGDPVLEVEAAKQILQASRLSVFGPEIISCPTCGRCQVDLAEITREFKDRLSGVLVPVRHIRTIAIMGCEVNGPGEAKDADIGIAAGKNSGMLFKKGKAVRKVARKDFVKVLMKEVVRD